MANSISGKLLSLAETYYISYGSPEQIKIDASVGRIKTKLKTYFGSDILSVSEFGSYKRDTILPRKYDEHSDVDLMIVFNHNLLNLLPGSYRTRLIRFAEAQYSRSEIYKSAPTVVLELDHIKYDLVPAYEQVYTFLNSKTTYIPKSDSEWMATDPNSFNERLSNVNKQNNWHIKRVIRLLKAWNAKVGYPLESYQLEQEIAGMGYVFCYTLEDYFFYAINGLSSYRDNYTATQKVTALKGNANRVKSFLQSANELTAHLWLSHILPL